MPSGLQRISAEWRAALAADTGPWLRSGLRRVARDRWMRWSLAGAVAVGAALLAGDLVGVDRTAWRDGHAFVLLGGTSALALALGARRATVEAERRLHLGAAAALLCWAGAEALETWLWSGDDGPLAIAIDALYLGFYGALLLATDDAARWRMQGEAIPLRRLERLELACFLLGLLVYFVVVPARSDPAGYLSSVPSSMLYLWLDAVLLAWITWHGRRARRARERFRWAMLLATAAAIALTDALDLQALSGGSATTLAWLDGLWYLPFVTLVAAARVGPVERATPPRSGAEDVPPEPPHADLGWALAALLPLSHLVTETFGGLGESTAAPRRAVIALATVALVGLAVRHQRYANRAGKRLLDAVDALRARDAAGARLEAIGELAGGVAHDFRHLVSELSQRAAALATRDLDAASRRDLDAMSRAADRAAALTRELLAVGQREPPQRRPLELRRWLLDVEPSLRELCGERVELSVVAGDRELWCAADPAQLERVAANLAANARDAMPAGGRLEIRLERLAVEAAGGRDAAAVLFRDEGAGMDRPTRERIFEPFFTTKTERVGHGLGLATALGLMRAHGGDIRVDSAPGAGSTFVLQLPLQAPHTRSEPLGPR